MIETRQSWSQNIYQELDLSTNVVDGKTQKAVGFDFLLSREK